MENKTDIKYLVLVTIHGWSWDKVPVFWPPLPECPFHDNAEQQVRSPQCVLETNENNVILLKPPDFKFVAESVTELDTMWVPWTPAILEVSILLTFFGLWDD